MAEHQLPPALAGDERFAILCELLHEEFDNLDLTPMLVYLIDIVPARVLPHLADQFHVMGLEGWRYARNDQERRALIKRASELHQFKGTPWAVEQVLQTLNLQGKVTEWFEYGGLPYHFRVDITLTARGLDGENFNALVDLINEYKNKRSRLQALTVTLVTEAPGFIASALLCGESTTIYPFQIQGIKQAASTFFAAGLVTTEITTLYPLES